MPKVSEEHKELRREQILEGAQRCFARYGYEGATVARLERETGLSRGAIFNYFENKEALFVELAVRTSARLTEIWIERGFASALEEIVEEDPDWISVQFEMTRRARTDPEFERQIEVRTPSELRGRAVEYLERRQQEGALRADVSVETLGIFMSLVANGLALRRSTGDPMPEIAPLVELLETGVRGGRPRKKVRNA